MSVGATIRAARDAAGLSQGELAEKAGVTRVYVSLLEHDKKSPTLTVYFGLCKALGVRPSTLMSRIEKGMVEP